MKKKQKQNKNKKKKILMSTLIPVGALALVAGIVTPVVLSKKNNEITVELDRASDTGVQIVKTNIAVGQNSTITLSIPGVKKINTLVIKIGGTTLTEGKHYALNGNIITIFGSAVTGGKIVVKVTLKDKDPPVIKVTSVTISNTTTEVKVNNELELTAVVLPEGATNKQLNWTVTAGTGTGEITTHDNKTYLKGLTEGTVTVTAASTDGSGKTNSKTFKVNPAEYDQTSIIDTTGKVRPVNTGTVCYYYYGDITTLDGELTIARENFDLPIIIGKDLTEPRAFLYSCPSFNQDVFVPKWVTKIDESFLAYTTKFNSKITFDKNIQLANIGQYFLSSSEDYTPIYNQPIAIPSTVTEIGAGFMYYQSSFNNVIDFSAITNPDNLTISTEDSWGDTIYFLQGVSESNTITFKVAKRTKAAWKAKLDAATNKKIHEGNNKWVIDDGSLPVVLDGSAAGDFASTDSITTTDGDQVVTLTPATGKKLESITSVKVGTTTLTETTDYTVDTTANTVTIKSAALVGHDNDTITITPTTQEVVVEIDINSKKDVYTTVPLTCLYNSSFPSGGYFQKAQFTVKIDFSTFTGITPSAFKGIRFSDGTDFPGSCRTLDTSIDSTSWVFMVDGEDKTDQISLSASEITLNCRSSFTKTTKIEFTFTVLQDLKRDDTVFNTLVLWALGD